VGGSGMIFDLGSYKIMRLAAFPVPAATVIAIWIAMTWNYSWNRRLTFHDSHKGSIPLQYLKFAAACSLGMVVSGTVRVSLVYWTAFFHERELHAAFLGIVAGTFSNFSISWLWVFRRRERRDERRCGADRGRSGNAV
jgi:putative flippase GtrA